MAISRWKFIIDNCEYESSLGQWSLSYIAKMVLFLTIILWQESLISDGMLMGSMFGTDTLQELRIAFTLAENERHGGIS